MLNQTMEIGTFAVDEGQAKRAALGLVVLQTDETIEHDARIVLPNDGVRLYANRIANAQHVSAETLGDMEQDLAAAASLFPQAIELDVIGYGCTSASLLIGESRVDECLRVANPNARTTNPFSALKAACRALGVRRLALLTPYAADISVAMGADLDADGIAITRLVSYAQEHDPVVARITPDSLLSSITDIGQHAACDAVFASCTNLRALDIIERAEQIIDKPVLASNQVMFWHMMQLAGFRDRVEHGGRLFGYILDD